MRRRKTKSKDSLGFRIGSVLGKHIAHKCLLDKIEQDGRIDVPAILFFLKQRCLLITSKHPVIMKKKLLVRYIFMEQALEVNMYTCISVYMYSLTHY